MFKINKALILTLFLLLIFMVEGVVVFFDITGKNSNDFTLHTAELDVPLREVIVPEFTFEKYFNDYANNILDDVDNEIKTNMVKDIYSQASDGLNETVEKIKNEEPKSTETAPKEEIEPQKLLNLQETEPKQLSENSNNKVMIAIVIDDMGISVPHTNDIINLKKPMTASFLTYGAANKKFAKKAQDAGFEIMLHTPMMPHVKADLAPITLSPEMSEAEIKTELAKMLDMYSGIGIKGINNHMGSLFTEDVNSMKTVLQMLKERNMFFLDSKTSAKSVGEKESADLGVPYIARDVFLDNENDYAYIMNQLKLTEKIAHKRGYAVAIGHPKSKTYEALRDWSQNLAQKGVRLVYLDDLVRFVNR